MDVVDIQRKLAASEPRDLSRGEMRQAAVAAILRDGPEQAEILFIRRADHPSDPWSGHMAFPGGRQDPEDLRLLDTAKRETLEEVGLDLASAELIGQLDDLQAVARGIHTDLMIRPFAFALRGDPIMRLNEEVAETIWAPIGPMLLGQVDTVRPYALRGAELELPAYDIEGRIVWGLTYQMLRSFFDALR